MVFSMLDLLCFFLFMILPYSTIAQTSRNIDLDSSLTARNDDNSSWSSPSGEFAFGFQQIGKDGFLLAIWFNKIPERTIVWSANGNNLVPQGSQVELTSDGQFMLKDATGKRIWYAESVVTGVAYAAMLDTGNFVLANQNSSTLWQSFNQPTDTILPTQTLNQNSSLYSHYTATNYSRGRFLFALQSDGKLVLRTTHFPQDSANSAYWPPETTNIGFQVIFNESGLILVSRNGSVTILSSPVSIQDFYQRATLGYDGVLRHYVYPKSTSSSAGKWPMAWSTSKFVPLNICFSIAEEMGGGACGFNSLCRLEDDRPICQCPKGYNSIDPNDALRGCKKNFVPQSCDQASPETDLFDFQEIQNTDFTYGDYEHFTGVTEPWCRQNCLDDCFCAVAILNPTGDCFKKRLPFSNGKIAPSVNSKALIKFGKENSTLRSCGGGAKDSVIERIEMKLEKKICREC